MKFVKWCEALEDESSSDGRVDCPMNVASLKLRDVNNDDGTRIQKQMTNYFVFKFRETSDDKIK